MFQKNKKQLILNHDCLKNRLVLSKKIQTFSSGFQVFSRYVVYIVPMFTGNQKDRHSFYFWHYVYG